LCPTVPFLVALLAALGCSEGGTIAQNADAAVEPHGDAAADAHADADAVPNPDAGQDAGSEDGGLVEGAYFVSPDGVVFGNVVTRTNRLGIYVDAWAGHCYNIEVFANLVFDCGGFGFAVATENGGFLENVRLFNNVAWGNEHGGFAVAGWGVEGKFHSMAQIAFVNNTAWGNGGTDTWGPGLFLDNPEAQDVLVRNNIFANNGFAQIEVDRAPAGLTVDHNLLFGAAGPDQFPGSITSDPLLADPAGADFHLLPGSPAVDVGSPYGAPSDDFDGVLWPQGAGMDLGAFELPVQAVGPVTPPWE